MARTVLATSAVALSLLAGIDAYKPSTSMSISSSDCMHTHTFTPIHTSPGQSYTTTSFTSTFSIPTAATAASTASDPTIDGGKKYFQYSTVEGYFLQDLNSTVASTFDYTATNFGLINQTYPTGHNADASLTQWQRFNSLVLMLNQNAANDVLYKLLFIGRHGEGYHNAAQTFYGTPAWNCYWSELTGNGTVTWADAHLDTAGIAQAIKANNFWASEIETQKIQPPESYYVSPLTRCLQTANYTYGNLTLPRRYPFIPTVKEFLREGISTHTCDHRSNKTFIEETFPSFEIDPTLSEYDEIWNGITAETSSAQDYRSKIVLDEIFSSDPATVISITTHSGEAGSLLRVLGHRVFSLVTGAIIPVLVKAEILTDPPATTTTMPWTTSAWCTNGPPITSQTTGLDACVCSNGVSPTAGTIASTITGV